MSTYATPWSGFSPAAEAAVRQLNRSVPGMDLWLATHVVDDRQIVVASAGAWAQTAVKGSSFSWQASFCALMVQRGPTVAYDIHEEPAFRGIARGPLAKVRAYLGVPLVRGEDELFGTLCAFAGSPRPASLGDGLPAVSLVGRLLGSILTGERTAHERSQEAAAAYALAQRDVLTGLLNRRGWAELVAREGDRCVRYGTGASVLVVRADDLADVPERSGHLVGEEVLHRLADVLSDVCPPCDAISRIERDQLAVLSVETDVLAARDLAARIDGRLRTERLSGSIGVASRREQEPLEATCARAAELATLEQRRRLAGRDVSRRAR